MSYRFLIATTRPTTGEVAQIVGSCRTFDEAVREAEHLAANAVGGVCAVIGVSARRMISAGCFEVEQNARDAAAAVVDAGCEAVVVCNPDGFTVLVHEDDDDFAHYSRGVVFGVAFARGDGT